MSPHYGRSLGKRLKWSGVARSFRGTAQSSSQASANYPRRWVAEKPRPIKTTRCQPSAAFDTRMASPASGRRTLWDNKSMAAFESLTFRRQCFRSLRDGLIRRSVARHLQGSHDFVQAIYTMYITMATCIRSQASIDSILPSTKCRQSGLHE